MFKAGRDLLVGKTAQAVLGRRFARYGRLESVRIDSQRHQAEFVLLPEGEVDSVTVRIDHYEISHAGARHFLRITASSCSRPWVARLLEDFVHGQRHEIPAWLAALL